MKKIKRSPKRRTGNDQWPSAEFAEFVREAVEEASDLGPAGQAHVLANCRLQADYPGEYVAYVDTFTGTGKKTKFRRKMIGHAKDIGDLNDQLTKLTEKVRAKATVHYVDDPNGPFEIRMPCYLEEMTNHGGQ